MPVVSSCLAPQSRTVRNWCGLLGLPLALILLSLSGCGKDTSNGDRIPLSGTVTAEGKPLDVPATISFVPVNGQDGVGASGGVKESKFTIPEENGPTPGKPYKVSLITVPGIPPPGTPRDQMKLPKHYETTIEIPSRGEEQPLQIDFK